MIDLDNLSVKARVSSDDEEDERIDRINKILFYRWKLNELLSSIEGYSIKFEEKLAPNVFKGINKKTKKKVIFKIEEINDDLQVKLVNESKILISLYKLERTPKIENIKMNYPYMVLITNYIGPSLRYYMKKCGGNFGLATTLKISIQIFNTLQQIHDIGIILVYLKPANLLMGIGENKDYAYIIDFDFAKFYIKDGEHIKEEKVDHIVGNRDFISINLHNYMHPSRRDDIESFGYNLVYFMKGKFPWSEIYHTEEIKEKKISTSLDELCEGLPEEFKEFIQYARNLKFEEKPDYEYLKGLLQKVIEKNNIDINTVQYDWTIKGVESKEKDEYSDDEEKYEDEKEISINSENEENNNDKKEEKQNLKENENLNEIKEKENIEKKDEEKGEKNGEKNEEKIEEKDEQKNHEINEEKSEEKIEQKNEKNNEGINEEKNEEKNEKNNEEAINEDKNEKNFKQ